MYLVWRGQTTIPVFLQGVIAFGISARNLRAQGITSCKNIAVWPREANSMH